MHRRRDYADDCTQKTCGLSLISMETKMNPLRTVSAAILLAASLIAPAVPTFAATMDAAKITVAAKTDVVPVDSLIGMIGKWDASYVTKIGSAASVKVFDTKTLYPAADQTKIASAETAKSADLQKLRDALKADSGLMGWFTTNKIDINRVVAVSDAKGEPELFLY